jgi:DNA-binding NtrC family response regulator
VSFCGKPLTIFSRMPMELRAMANERILIVDDDVDVRRCMQEVLRDAGYDVVAVDGSVDALKHIWVRWMGWCCWMRCTPSIQRCRW